MPRGDGLEGTWAYGANLDFLRELCVYWGDQYDWRKWEAELNRFPQFIADADGLDIHFYHEVGSGPSPKPLILSHGWPGSVFEFLHIIDKLAHPEKHGGDVKDAFTVVVPSLPGYGWSDKPKRPIGPRTSAKHFDALMTKVLRQPGYIARRAATGAAAFPAGWLTTVRIAAPRISTCSAGARRAFIRRPMPRNNTPHKPLPHSFQAEGAYFPRADRPSRRRFPTR